MEQKLVKAFQAIKYESDTKNLTENVWHAVVLYDKRAARLKLWTFSLVGFISLLAFIPAYKALTNDLAQSGFFEYLSMGFWYSGSMLSNWKEFAWSLLESLPTMSIILSLTTIFIFFLSAKYAVKQIIRNQLSLSF